MHHLHISWGTDTRQGERVPDRRIEYLPLDTIKPAKRNPKQHAEAELGDSLDAFGYTEPLLLDERTGRLVAGHGRVKALKTLKTDGAEPPDGIQVSPEGAWLAPVVRGWTSRDDDQAEAYLLASNQLTALGGYDNTMLLEMLSKLEKTQSLVGTGFGAKDIEKLVDELKAAREPAPAAGDEAATPEGIDDVPEPPAEPYVKAGEVYQLGRHRITCGDSKEVVPTLEPSSVHAVVTDPPYEIAFMGRAWDASGIAYDKQLWGAVMRALPPGGHILSFGATRTFHRMACAIEDVGMEIRDTVLWLYGSGFPKSHDVSKAIDEAAGAERKVIGTDKNRGVTRAVDGKKAFGDYAGQWDITAPATAAAKAWAGWGTALKPAVEPAVLARKPLEGTVAENVLKHATGGINVDGCRVGVEGGTRKERSDGDKVSTTSVGGYLNNEAGELVPGMGRWPANVMLDERAAEALDEQTKEQTSRFFYVAKASRTERDAGLEDRPGQTRAEVTGRKEGSAGAKHARAGAGSPDSKNHHPTVKPVALMRHLVRLIAPPGGTVLEPFSGSGTTLLACELEGVACVAVEREPAYVQLAIARWEGLTKGKAVKVQ